jgi:hypothetical protein
MTDPNLSGLAQYGAMGAITAVLLALFIWMARAGVSAARMFFDRVVKHLDTVDSTMREQTIMQQETAAAIKALTDEMRNGRKDAVIEILEAVEDSRRRRASRRRT